MLNFIDKWLNRITMYRLVLYFLFALITIALILSFFRILPCTPVDLVYSVLVLTIVSLLTNKIFAKAFGVPANAESDYITAWILALIITPSTSLSVLPLLVGAAVLAQASKYILAFRGKHIFNPSAIAVVITAIAINQTASWWVGTAWMLPFVLIGGLLVARKIQRFDLVLTFLVISVATIVVTSISYSDPVSIIRKALLDSPVIFFGFIMLTEPMTTPPVKSLRMVYGAFVGLMFAPRVHIGSIYSTPELALVVGNIFAYIVSPKIKLLLTLKSKTEIGTNMVDFEFTPNRSLPFKPGQYLEWTLDHKNPDTRGNRRYFTIASSPTEKEIHLGVKFYENASSFKKTLIQLKPGDQILAGQLAGNFTLPKNLDQKLVFIAGGIGITPFRSMLKYLIDKNEKRPITLFYSNRTEKEASYEGLLFEAQEKLGIKTIFVVSEKQGQINRGMIENAVPDFKEQMFYISGTHGMVVAFEDTLRDMGVTRSQIKIDFFPGFV